MKFKGHTLETHYLPGSDFNVSENNACYSRKVTAKDIDYIRCIPDDNSMPFNTKTIKEAKAFILRLNTIGSTK